MQIDGLDEVDFSLNLMIRYVRSYGVHGAQLEKLFAEKLQAAFAIADQFEDSLADVSLGAVPNGEPRSNSPLYG